MHLRELHCEIQQQLGRLSHSWLKNQIITIDPSLVVLVRRDAGLVDARLDFEGKIQPGGEFDSRINETRALIHRIIDGFSPQQLVDAGPLAELSSETREAIKSVIHREYLANTEVEQAIEPMNRAIDELENALRAFSRIWFQQDPGDADTMSAFEQLQLRAKALQEEMANLPEGIVLP